MSEWPAEDEYGEFEDCGRTPEGKIIMRMVIRRRPAVPWPVCELCDDQKEPHKFLFKPIMICWDCSHIVRGKLYLRTSWEDDCLIHMAQVVLAHMEREIERQRPRRRAAGRTADPGVQPGGLHEGPHRRSEKATVW